MTDLLNIAAHRLADFGHVAAALFAEVALWTCAALVVLALLEAASRASLSSHPAALAARRALSPSRRLGFAQATLFALPFALTAALLVEAFDLSRLFAVEVPLSTQFVARFAHDATITVAGGATHSWPSLGAMIVGTAVLLALVVALVRLVVLTVHWARLRSGHGLPATRPLRGEALCEASRVVAEVLGIRNRVALRVALEPCVSFVAPAPRPTVVLSAELLDDPAALRLALRHELTHIARGDLHWSLAEQVALALVWWHPLAHSLARYTTTLREEACDALVAESRGADVYGYASLLARCAERHAAAPLTLSLPLARPSHLRRRIHLLLKPIPTAMETPRLNLTLALALFACLAVFPACTDMVTGDEETATALDTQADMEARSFAELSAEEKALHGDAYVVVEKMPEIIGGLASVQNAIVYPELAKKAGIEGRVFMQFIVDVDGSVRGATVARGIGGGCDEAALAALQQVTFTPGKQRGEAVPVKMSLPITFKLGEGESGAAPGDEGERRATR